MAVMILTSYFFRHQSEHIIALSLVGWIWPLRTIRLVLEDMTGLILMNRVKYIILGLGGFISLALGSYGHSFLIYTTPFALSVGAVGFSMLTQVYRKMSKEMRTPLWNTTSALLAGFFLVRFLFPYWRVGSEDLITSGFAVDLMILIGLGASTLSLFMEVMKERHEKMMKEVIKERNDQLFGQSKYSELGMMSAGIAHEINNPLAIIQAKTTQLLRIYRDRNREKEMADGLQQVLFTSERINRTIQGVREFVHQDDRMPDEDISLKHLVDDVLAFCGQRMKNHGVNLRFYGLENYTVRGHKIQLEQVILNLLNNSFDAIEFLPDKWIEMSVHETPESLQMYFKDSGAGIPPEVASRMMEPFFTTKDVGKGTGLGLALARGIAEKHGGSLVYISNTPHTTFMFELPKRNLSQELGRRGHRPESGLPLIH